MTILTFQQQQLHTPDVRPTLTKTLGLSQDLEDDRRTSQQPGASASKTADRDPQRK